MNPEDFIEIGYFQKPHSYKGQLPVFVTTTHEVLFDKLKFIMLEINGMLTPFFIEKIDVTVILKQKSTNQRKSLSKKNSPLFRMKQR